MSNSRVILALADMLTPFDDLWFVTLPPQRQFPAYNSAFTDTHSWPKAAATA